LTAVASLTFLSPIGALVSLAALAPLAALFVARRRVREVTSRLGLRPPADRSLALRAALITAALVLLGLAAARPAVRTTDARVARTDAQAFFVLDVSRSMLASSGPEAPTRLERAKAVALRLRAAAPDVPAGVAGLTDRVLPYVFPTSDPGVFATVLARSVAVEAPPPGETHTVATTFEAIAGLQRRGFFPGAVDRRLCVVLTDGESRPFEVDSVAEALLTSPPCRLVVVRVGDADERIFAPGGPVEAEYRPLETAASSLETLVSATGGRLFEEGEVGAAGSRLESLAGTGPTTHVGVGTKTTELAFYLSLAAGAVILVLLVGAAARRRFSLPTRNEISTIPPGKQA
jgi:von Willebrand factor type A domain